ncbi:hypothetical protein GMLC_05240 [Geomonas limicola]|uniref:DoxX family protein n=1 Tax=Geomonas limicola TaxID=2740186 RepID=A0A6V8N314_9BACT|nr:DoxX family protein [Geomonas limicola]GFO66945.1 hypothetical protein GMLC_05240 [Geomonas limicola]
MNTVSNMYHDMLHMLHLDEKGVHEHHQTHVTEAVVLFGRVFFAAIFLFSAPQHFSSQTIEYAAAQGVPLASFLVPVSGIIAFVGALSVLFGFHARIGGWLLVLFLVPVTLMMHAFWKVDDPGAAQIQMIMFMKNLAMLGGALLITQFGSGPLSLDSRHHQDGY